MMGILFLRIFSPHPPPNESRTRYLIEPDALFLCPAHSDLAGCVDGYLLRHLKVLFTSYPIFPLAIQGSLLVQPEPVQREVFDMSKVKMTEEEKKAWLEKTTGYSIVAKVGINERGNAIVVQDASSTGSKPHMRDGTIRVVEMTAGTDLPSIKSKNVVASKVISVYSVELSDSGREKQNKLQEKGIEYAQGVLRGEKNLSRSMGI